MFGINMGDSFYYPTMSDKEQCIWEKIQNPSILFTWSQITQQSQGYEKDISAFAEVGI